MTAPTSYAKMIPCTTVLLADPNAKREAHMDQPKFTVLYWCLSNEDSLDDKSSSIVNQELICRGWCLHPNTYDCGSFVMN